MLKPMPFIFRYRVHHEACMTLSDPTGGFETPYVTNYDSKNEQDHTDDEDEEDNSPLQTGLIADSGTKDDDEY